MSTDSQQRMSIYLLIVLRMFIHSLILLFKIKKKKKKKKNQAEVWTRGFPLESPSNRPLVSICIKANLDTVQF